MAVREAQIKKITNLYPEYNKIFFDTIGEKPTVKDQLFKTINSNRASESFLDIIGLDVIKPFAGSFQEDQIYQGNEKVLIPDEYGLKVTVERKIFDDDEYGVIEQIPKKMARAERHSINVTASGYFDDAFSSSTTGDGQALCADAHVSAYNSSYTFDNLGTSALSATNLEIARRAMIAFRDERNNKSIELSPDMLIVPRALEETAYEIIAASGKVDTDLNNPNFHQGKYKVLVVDHLSDANDWFLVDSSLMKECLMWVQRVPLEFKQDVDFNTLQRMYAMYERFDYGALEWRWIYGSQVS